MAVMKCPNPKCKADMVMTGEIELFDKEGENVFDDNDVAIEGDAWHCEHCYTQVVTPKGCMEE